MSAAQVVKFRIEKPAAAVSGTIAIPAPGAQRVEFRYRSLADRDAIDLLKPEESWSALIALKPAGEENWYQMDVNGLGLQDGIYEYEFVINGDENNPVPDPFAETIEKFGGYRGALMIRHGVRVAHSFSWDDELPQGVTLPNNNQMVIYEMPVHWMDVSDKVRRADLGTFEKIVFEHLQNLRDLGINALELLPIQDSKDTLTWGYGTRFFYAPDWDMGTPLDLRVLVKCCHRFGMRVILDVVMNHSKACPLETLARDWYYLHDDEEPGRQGWGGVRFRYANPAPGANGKLPARDFLYDMARFWVREYHIDGFRIDDFADINNYDFIQGFRDHAWAEHNQFFPDRPFTVIAEDSQRRAAITGDHAYNDHPVADAIWNFTFRDELRRLLSNTLQTQFGQPGRFDRIQNMISGQKMWDDWNHQYAPGFSDMAKAINYVTSHDTQERNEERLMDYFLGDLLRQRGLVTNPTETETELIKRVVDNISSQPPAIQAAHQDALERIGSAFALMLTSAGAPMFLAGEEFGDVHDFEHSDPFLKQVDPVDYTRADYPGHRDLRERIRQFITLRVQTPGLQRNEAQFFYSHPEIDNDNGVKVFAYCRTAGLPLGNANQVVVFVNAGPQNFFSFAFPWLWGNGPAPKEIGAPLGATLPGFSPGSISLALAPFQVRIFIT
jgi:1,4-alpha-glucan branching enzyme